MKKLYPVERTFVFASQQFKAGVSVWLSPQAKRAIERYHGTDVLGVPVEAVEAQKTQDPQNPAGGQIATSLKLLERAKEALLGGNGNEIKSVLKEVNALQANGNTTYPTKEENATALELWVVESEGVLTGKLSSDDLKE